MKRRIRAGVYKCRVGLLDLVSKHLFASTCLQGVVVQWGPALQGVVVQWHLGPALQGVVVQWHLVPALQGVVVTVSLQLEAVKTVVSCSQKAKGSGYKQQPLSLHLCACTS